MNWTGLDGINKDMIHIWHQDLQVELQSFLKEVRRQLMESDSLSKETSVVFPVSSNGAICGELCLSINLGKIPVGSGGLREPQKKGTLTKRKSRRNSTP